MDMKRIEVGLSNHMMVNLNISKKDSNLACKEEL